MLMIERKLSTSRRLLQVIAPAGGPSELSGNLTNMDRLNRNQKRTYPARDNLLQTVDR
jgi:hypothetical protein